tara:strand:+ start:477 stop:860 length:384 start_codon:yes stop_codon:yes gene_type:complete
MPDYTIQELEDMLATKQVEEAEASKVLPVIETYENAIRTAGDFENQKFTATNNGVNLIIGHNIKSNSENKQMTIQRKHAVETTPAGNFICHALIGKSVSTGSYSDSLTTPSVQIIETRIKDTRILRG